MLHRKLKIKLLFVQLLAIIPFLVFIFYLFDLWFDTRRTLILQENINNAQLISLYINESFKKGLTLSSIIAADTFFHDNLLQNKQAVKNGLVNFRSKTEDFDGISIFDVNGKIISTTLDITDQQVQEVDISDRDYFAEAVNDKKMVVGNPIVGRFTGNLVVPLAAPLLIDNKVEAVVVTSLVVENLKQKVESNLYLNSDKIVALFDGNKQLVFTLHKPFPEEKVKGLMTDDTVFAKNLLYGKPQIIENQIIPLSEKPVSGALVALAEYPWAVLSVESTESIFSPLFKLQSIIWLIIFFALLFSVAAVTYFIRKVRIVY